jgi:prepilin-type N-terminal cleavage/methylation domain-containing protein
MRPEQGAPPAKGGFTMVEILVACAVLATLVVFVAQMVGNASSVTGSSRKRMDADEEARAAFDMLAGDIASMVKRADINPLFIATPGNDRIFFYSMAPAYSTNPPDFNSQVALVGYVATNATNGPSVTGTNGLLRDAVLMTWDQVGFTPLSAMSGTTNATPEIQLGLTNFHSIAPSVCRFEYSLLMRPGSVNADGSTNGEGVYSQTNTPGLSLKDVSAIVVAIAVLDPTSRKIAPADVDTRLAAVMQDALISSSAGSGAGSSSNASGIPVESWQSNVLTAPGLPKAVTSQVRIYRRFFPINP